MSTRATYVFKEADEQFVVYVHCDGYPSGAAKYIARAVPLAWSLPRFEANEFACAFICGAGLNPGYVRLAKEPDDYGPAYMYEITERDGALNVACYGGPKAPLFQGSLKDFTAWASTYKES